MEKLSEDVQKEWAKASEKKIKEKLLEFGIAKEVVELLNRDQQLEKVGEELYKRITIDSPRIIQEGPESIWMMLIKQMRDDPKKEEEEGKK